MERVLVEVNQKILRLQKAMQLKLIESSFSEKENNAPQNTKISTVKNARSFIR